MKLLARPPRDPGLRVTDSTRLRKLIRGAVTIIRDHVGERWLDDVVSGRRSTPPENWLVGAYASGLRLLSGPPGIGVQVGPELIRLTDFARHLARACKLPGFALEVDQQDLRMELPNYELHLFVACMASRIGRQVHFVPPLKNQPGLRTPDLAFDPPDTVYIECKRKERYTGPFPPNIEEEWADRLEEDLLQLAHSVGRDLEIVVMLDQGSGDLDPVDVTKLIETFARQRLPGVFVDPEKGFSIAVRQAPAAPAWARGGAWIPFTKRPSVRGMATVSMMPWGPVTTRQVYLSLYEVLAAPMKSVLNTFGKAAGQVPADGPGVVYIDVDVDRLEPADAAVHVLMLQARIAAEFKPRRHTRIGAVVFTGPPLLGASQDGWMATKRPSAGVINPHGSLPPSYRLPLVPRPGRSGAKSSARREDA